jgi:hypothetical protein
MAMPAEHPPAGLPDGLPGGLPADLPAEARTCIAQELAAGNALLQVLAPPAGLLASLYVMLARPLQATGAATSDPSAGEPRRFGELAPGLPAVVVMGCGPIPEDAAPPAPARPERPTRPAGPPLRAGAAARFERSMVLDHDAWREGSGYDLDAITEATPAERQEIAALLAATGLRDWRDIEAAARLDGREGRRLLRRAWREGGTVQRMALLRRVPGFVSEAQRVNALVEALAEVRPFEGLGDCLAEVEDCHPPAVIAALWRAAEGRGREAAVHCAAMLAFLHGLAATPFDWDQRPFFLRCASDDAAERTQALAELRRRILRAD